MPALKEGEERRKNESERLESRNSTNESNSDGENSLSDSQRFKLQAQEIEDQLKTSRDELETEIRHRDFTSLSTTSLTKKPTQRGHGYRACNRDDDCGYGERCCTLEEYDEFGAHFEAYECAKSCK